MKKNAFEDISDNYYEKPEEIPKNIRNDLLILSLRYRHKEHQSSLLGSIYSMASTFYYNYLPINSKFTNGHFDSIDYGLHPHLFHKGYNNQKDFDNELFSLFYMSYRNNINPMYAKNDPNPKTSDCGWGCMIRSAQMILSKGLFELKKVGLAKDNIGQWFQYQSVTKLRETILLLFHDNSIPIETAICSKEYQYFFKQMESIASTEIVQEDIEEIIPPFSIQTLALSAQSIGKWTSGITMVNTIIDINRQLYKEIRLFHHINNYGGISQQLLYETFCKQLTCNCDINLLVPKICTECLVKEIVKDNDDNITTHKDTTYKFEQNGIIFISMRLGLDRLEKEYLEDVKSLFDIKNNIGFIGGKDNRAYYFIGYSADHFMLIDPHFNQDVIDIKNKDLSSYTVKDIYLLDPNDLSPELTLGIVIHNMNDLQSFIRDMKQKKTKNNLITIKD